MLTIPDLAHENNIYITDTLTLHIGESGDGSRRC